MNDYDNCKKCGSKLALLSTCCTWGEWDSMPYEAGKEEPVLYKNGDEKAEPFIEIYFVMLVCPDCDYCEWLSIEDANYKIQSVCNHTISEKYGWVNGRYSERMNPLPLPYVGIPDDYAARIN